MRDKIGRTGREIAEREGHTALVARLDGLRYEFSFETGEHI